MTGCSGHVDNVNVHFHGGASWLYNIFSGSVERPIRNSLQSMVRILNY